MSDPDRLRCALIGVGRRALEDYVPALIELAPQVEFTAACDVDPGAETRLAHELRKWDDPPRPRFFTDRTAVLDAVRPDIAIVATPHHAHLEVATDLIARGIPFIKEKPFAISLPQAHELAHALARHDGHMRLCVQRRHHPPYARAKQVLPRIGEVRHFDAIYQLSTDAYRVGWRAHSETAGGGAIIDMGYHIVDLLHWFFGMPSLVYATTAPKLIPSASYDIEETVLANLTYAEGTTGTLRLSLCETSKEEIFRISGTQGLIKLTRESCELYDRSNDLVERFSGERTDASATTVLADVIARLSDQTVVQQEVSDGVDITSVIDSLYCSIAQQSAVKPVLQETCSACLNARHRRWTPPPRPRHGVPVAKATTRMV